MIKIVATCNERVITFSIPDDLNEITAGSLPDNTIYLPYKGISRRHFRLIRDGTKWLLQDCGSTNGTRLNGKIVTEAPLRMSDTIEVGIVKIRLDAAGEEIQLIEIAPAEFLEKDSGSTDRLGVVKVSTDRVPFSFPNLVYPEGTILGKSSAMMEIYQKIHSIADTDLSLLLVGETGTGKEILAKTLHLSGKRSAGAFVAVNCAAIPADLVETELFGIGERVATNVSSRKGKMAEAHGGTLFLDELASFPVALQPKILRALEEKTVTPLGLNTPVPADFRIISATNEDPVDLLKARKLREDLYHRVATVEIKIPPLRERKEDLEVLIPGLLSQISARENKRLSGISKRLFALLLNYSYPGNVRELLNILRSMVALAHPGEILDKHLVPERLLTRGPVGEMLNQVEPGFQAGKVDLRDTIDTFTKSIILRALESNQGSVRKAAAQLNVTPFGLRKMMKRFGIKNTFD